MTLKKWTLSLFAVVALQSALSAAPIMMTDVPKADPNYSAIQSSVEGGYFLLFENNTFQPDKQLTRREAAVLLDKLMSEMDGKGLTLSKTELQDLSNLSKRFKSLLAEQDLQNTKVNADLDTIKAEQKVIQHDLSVAYGIFNGSKDQRDSLFANNAKFMKDYESFKEKSYDQQVSLWIGIGLAALLGIIL